MKSLPLADTHSHHDVMAWAKYGPVTWKTFLAQVAGLSRRLPEKLHVINLCSDPYWFMMGFLGALNRQQTTLLPPSGDNQSLKHLASVYRDTYCLIDRNTMEVGIECYNLTQLSESSHGVSTMAHIPEDRVAAVVFTSGTTGVPRPNVKTWGNLVCVAKAMGRRLRINRGERIAIAATVPPGHMYGLEASIMLPLQYGLPIVSPRPFFPEDIRISLERVPSRRALITTPLQIRACLTEQIPLPRLDFILSATAPLSHGLALEAEKNYQTNVVDLYGFTEAGSVATRRRVIENKWHLLDGLTLVSTSNGNCIYAPYLDTPVPFPDIIGQREGNRFLLQGRNEDLVKIGGRRVALGDLNSKLNEVAGVEDGVFFLPEDDGGRVTRLVAFVVAPGKHPGEILSGLKTRIEQAFLPREVFMVSSLPRNETGKITRETLIELLAVSRQGKKGGKISEWASTSK